MTVLIDYGMGNLRSVLSKLARVGVQATVSSDRDEIAAAERLVLPGVGSFAAGMTHLDRHGLISVLDRKVREEHTPILGICLGMQLFCESGEEGDSAGLGWVRARARRFEFDPGNNLKVPHVGWNEVRQDQECVLWNDLPADSRFYFTHSYYIDCEDSADVVGTTHYGHDFASVIRHENVYGTQFHPEKSHRAGLQLIRNFVENT